MTHKSKKNLKSKRKINIHRHKRKSHKNLKTFRKYGSLTKLRPLLKTVAKESGKHLIRQTSDMSREVAKSHAQNNMINFMKKIDLYNYDEENKENKRNRNRN